ncbi:hypothetical protein EDEG_02465 [Edhazardia aedis USNM 41457]|uniref:Uncharacterized protein n=1 Tax=Edhazardia aedis (strain USNM 41457) TaxID=1003232 RepID=J9DKP4_EDHAE|nr:hypothetical protein EDEG_02465 [Edhazardia aedis USNM 41457]|eukprot:EJW03160.1 hypothetical protein EDEG_02465 [Edhazardia aedis USNM 41457]
MKTNQESQNIASHESKSLVKEFEETKKSNKKPEECLPSKEKKSVDDDKKSSKKIQKKYKENNEDIDEESLDCSSFFFSCRKYYDESEILIIQSQNRDEDLSIEYILPKSKNLKGVTSKMHKLYKQKNTKILRGRSFANSKEILDFILELTKNNQILKTFDSEFIYNTETNSLIPKSTFVDNKISVRNSVLGQNCIIKADIDHCFISDNCNVTEPQAEKLILKTETIDLIKKPDVKKKKKKLKNTKSSDFFSDVQNYLTTAFEDFMDDKVGVEKIAEQLTQYKIVWSASNLEMVEAFGKFVGRTVSKAKDYEDKAIDLSQIFSVITGQTKDMDVQVHLIFSMNDTLDICDSKEKIMILFKITFLQCEEGLVSKKAMRKSKLFTDFGL